MGFWARGSFLILKAGVRARGPQARGWAVPFPGKLAGEREPGLPPPWVTSSSLLGSLLPADMAESSSLPSSSAAALAPEPGVTEQPGPRSAPPSPPGLEEPPDGADPDVPHPDLAPVAFFCLRQTTSPRNWCIKMVCNPYPSCGRGWSGPRGVCSLMAPGLLHLPLVRRPEAAGPCW